MSDQIYTSQLCREIYFSAPSLSSTQKNGCSAGLECPSEIFYKFTIISFPECFKARAMLFKLVFKVELFLICFILLHVDEKFWTYSEQRFWKSKLSTEHWDLTIDRKCNFVKNMLNKSRICISYRTYPSLTYVSYFIEISNSKHKCTKFTKNVVQCNLDPTFN